MTKLAIHPLTPDRWDDFVTLFETDSICRMCWCVYHRLPSVVRRETPSAARKDFMRKVVKKGPPPGLLAYRGSEAVGWLAITPRPDQPGWNTGRKASAVVEPEDADDTGNWGATCFFIRRDARGGGIATELLDAGVKWAKKNGAHCIEAAPMEHGAKRSPAGLFVGPKRVFDRAGFTTLIERKEGRPLMRLQLKGTKSKPKPAKTAATVKAGKPKPKSRAR